MLRRNWLIAGVIGVGVAVAAIPLYFQSYAGPSQDGSSATVLKCPDASVDFGRIYRPTDVLDHVFRITNRGERMLALEVGHRSCTCAEAELSQDQLAPGEVTELKVRWNVPNRLGKEMFSVLVSEPSAPKKGIWLSGRAQIVDLLHVVPDELDLGELQPGSTAKSQIVLHAPAGRELSREIRIEPPTASYAEWTARIASRTNKKLVVEIGVTGTPGKSTQLYDLAIATGEDRQPLIQVPVKVVHLDHFQAVPSAVLFTQTGREAAKSVVIKCNTDRDPASIERIEVDRPEWIACRRKENGSDGVELLLEPLNARSQVGAYATGQVAVWMKGEERAVLISYMVIPSS